MAKDNESLYLAPQNIPSVSKKKVMVIIAGVLIFLVIASAMAYFVLMYQSSNSEANSTANLGDNNVVGSSESGTNYVPMPRPFVFNVMEGHRDRLVQIKVQLMVKSEANEILARKHIPLLEGALVSVFSAASAQQLRSPKGKVALRESALNALNEATTRLEGRGLIHAVLFTGFVLQ